MPTSSDPALRSSITALLAAAASTDGGEASARDLLPLLYTELRRLARARIRPLGPAASVDATALVHEAWVRLAGDGDATFRSRAHFLAAAALAMRHVLVDHARRRARLRRGGGRAPLSLSTEPAADGGAGDVAVLDVEQALVALEQSHPRPAQVVTLRYFGGLGNGEIAAVLGVSDATVERDWSFARAWLHRALHGGGDGTR